jgi:flagellar protein FlaJ
MLKEKTEKQTQAEQQEKDNVKRLLGKKKFEMKKAHWIGLISAVIIIAVSGGLLFTPFVDPTLFYFIAGISLVVAGLPFFTSLIMEGRVEQDKEQMFLEFSRDLVEGVKSGTSISKSILNIKTKDYGSLNKHIAKLANQISLGITLKEALDNFARDIGNTVITRAVTLIQEAERAGGKIETILESVAISLTQIEKLRKERRAAIYNLVVQGYIVFLIFIAIMLVMQFKILPITSDIGTAGAGLAGGGFGLGTQVGGVNLAGSTVSIEDMSRSFMWLLIVQGFFAGLVIGKISEGTVKAGLKHSFVLVTLALLISTGANVLFV